MMTEALANFHMSKQVKKPDKTATFVKTNSAVNVFNLRQEQIKRGGSFVVGQKLRESKWFNHNEIGIFCAVVETGFIVENKQQSEEANQFGVATWTPGFEKSKNPDQLTICTINENKGKFKVLSCTLAEFWPDSTQLRINNKSDKTETPLTENVIRNQILHAQNSKRKWHNTEHFSYFCRYGPVETSFRTRKITDQLRWNTGQFFLKFRSLSQK